eukprot:SAG31_NODE_1547_length_7925_cov_3.563251_7_plen_62_part_00
MGEGTAADTAAGTAAGTVMPSKVTAMVMGTAMDMGTAMAMGTELRQPQSPHVSSLLNDFLS